MNTKPVAWYVINRLQCSENKIFGVTMRFIIKKKNHNLYGQLRKEKINKLLAGLYKLQSNPILSREVTDGAVKASYLQTSWCKSVGIISVKVISARA